MTKLRGVPLLALFSLIYFTQAQQDDRTVAADIVFLVDASWSIGQENFQSVREFLFRVIKAFDIGGNRFRFGLVQYSEKPQTEFHLNTYFTKQDILFHIWNMSYKGGGTKTGLALEYLIKDQLTKANGNRAEQGVPQIIIVLTDGQSQDDVIPPSASLKSADAIIFAIGVQQAVEWELKEIASAPHERFVYHLDDFAALKGIVNDLVASVHMAAAHPLSDGIIKDVTAQESADLIFLIDGSVNVGSGNFQYIRDFIVNFIDNLEIGPDRVQIGVVQYSDEPSTEFYFNTYSTKTEVLDAVKRLQPKGGDEINTGAAVQFLVDNHFIESAGSRASEGVPQALVIISSSESSDDITQADLLLKQGSIYSFSIGGRDADTNELVKLATDTSFTAVISEFRDIANLQQQFLPLVSSVARGEVILEPLVITEVRDRRKDIVFLIDGSSRLGGANFMRIREFILKIVNKFQIGPDAVRVAVVQYSETQHTEFYLNDHKTRSTLQISVKGLRSKGGPTLNTGAALEYVLRNHFVKSAGSRKEEGVPQFLVLVVGEESTDSIRRPAFELKQAAIMTFAIGVGDASQAEMQEIAFGPFLVFEASDFQNLIQKHKEVQTKIATLGPPTVTTEAPTVIITEVSNRDIVFLIDGSVNVGNAYFPALRDFIRSIIETLNIGSDRVRVAVVQYSDDARTEFYLNSYSKKAELVSHVNGLRLKGGRSLNTGAALDYVFKNVFTKATGSRIEDDVPQILLVVTAGKSEDDVRRPAEALARGGIVTIAIGLNKAETSEIQRIAFHKSVAHQVNDFSALDAIRASVGFSVRTLIHGGIIEMPSAMKRDIVFLIDGSPGMGRSLLQVREFLMKVIQELDIGPDKNKIAVVQYSSDPRVEFGLDTYLTKREVLEAIKTLVLKTGKPLNTGAALDYVTKNVFSPSAGSRRDAGVSQILVLITAGKSKDDVGQAAVAVKQAGIVPIAIGAKGADTSELQKIVHDPTFVLTMKDFQDLSTIQQELLARMRTLIIFEQPTEDAVKRDVVFLVDGSDKVRDAFPAVQRFISGMVDNLDIGSDKVRVGVVQYSDDPRVNFYLNSYTTKRDVKDAINSLGQIGGRRANTGEALDYVTKNIFTRSAGGRAEEGVPQFLILLTASKSTDDVSQAALALKQAGVAPFSIGSRDADDSELQQISLSPGYIFKVDDLQNVETVQQRLQSPLTTLSKDRIIRIQTTILGDAIKRDVVFLVDGSDKVRAAFPAVQRFISRMVDNLEIGSDKVRVGVVQYSDDPRVNFYLNSYTTKRDVKDAINNLGQIGGRRANTGEALDYVTKNIFTRSAGGRAEEGVPQFLILLTASKSTDDVSQAALALKQAGVAPFSIGSRDADDGELQQISLSPNFIFKVDDLQNVETIQQSMESPLIRLNRDQIIQIHTKVEDAVKRDVVFLVDGSDKVRAAFPAVQRFISRMVDNIDVGSDKVRVGVVQYSDDPRVNFYLNSYTTKRDVKDAINNLGQIGGGRANTGEALDYVTKNIFTRSAGGRAEEGVPQFLILLTASKSTDDVSQAALALKQAGVAPFSIGSRDADDSELQQISLSPGYIFKVDDLQNVETVQQRLQSPLITLNKDQIIRIRTMAIDDAKKRDVVFLVDGSDKVRAAFPAVQRFISRMVDNLDVGNDKVRVGVVQYSDDPRVNFYLNSYTTKRDVKDAINNLGQIGGRRANTGEALDYVTKNIFTQSAGGRAEEGVPQFLILLTASKSTDDVSQAALALKQAGVAPFSIGSRDADDSELQQISLSPGYIFKVDDLQNVETVQQRLQSPLITLNKDQIIRIQTTVIGDAMKRDVVFLVDGSDKVRAAFPAVQRFISRMVDNIDVGSDKVRVGVVQYSDDPRVNFYLNSYTTKRDVKDAINNLGQIGGRRANTGEALDYVTKNIFTRSAGGRAEEGVPQFLILLTASKSTDDVSQAALALKQAGVAPFSIGSRDADDSELQQISLSPGYIFKVDDLQNVETVQQRLQSPLTTLSKDQIIRIRAAALEDAIKRDVVFLVDGSDKVRAAFPAVQRFISRMVDNIDVGSDKVRVGVVQYSDDPRVNFYLNSYTTKRDVKDAINNLGRIGGRRANTGEALDYVTKNIFTQSAGGRAEEGVPQFLILLTASKSTDDVSQAALALKQAGVAPFSIGSRDADDSELQQISLSPGYIFKVDDLQNVQTVQQRLQSPLTTLSKDRIIRIRAAALEDAIKRDVVFLVDGSDKVRAAFPAVQRFISRMVDNIDVGSDKVRVGVVQYSDDPRVNFYLNSYTTKRDVKDAINNLGQIGGRRANTGEALDYVTKNIFTRSAGGRAEEGVPQFLILLTAGKSTDDVSQAALALKQAGVAPFSIGSRDADDSELQQISLSPDYIFKVDDLQNVETVQQRLQSPLTTLSKDRIIRIRAAALEDAIKRDVVFLVDGSDKVRAAFPAVKRFISRLVDNLDVGSDKVRVGVVQYSDDPRVGFFLNSHTTKRDVKDAINNLGQIGGRRANTGEALDYVTKNIFTRPAGGRAEEGVPQFLILLTASKSTDDVSQAALALKRAGVAPFSIGSRDADDSELQQISLSPDYIFKVDDLQNVETVQQRMESPLRTLSKNRIIRIQTKALEDAAKRDIVFLVDESDKVRAAFPSVKNFISKVVDNLDVESDKVRVSVAQYSDNPRISFLLNTYATKNDVKRAIGGLRHRGGRRANTGKALDHVKKNLFSSSAGSRAEEGVPQFLILLTASKSSDDVRQAALALKQAGVAPFSIGSRDADDSELQQISLSPNYIFKVDDLQNVETVQQVLQSPLTTLNKDQIIQIIADAPEVPDTDKRDIIFLLDGSNTVAPAFPAVRSFISTMIDNLDIGIDKVRVGVVQYSDDPRVEFLLNAYTTKPEVQAAVRSLQLKGGQRINTGKALNYVKNNLFTKPTGSRIHENVPQFLILLTAGKSTDQVNQASLALKQAGVAPFSIGSRNADDRELQQISLSPDYIYRVNDLRNVQSIQQHLMVPLSTLNTDQIKAIYRRNPTEPSDTVKKDIVFLLDGSSSVGPQQFAHIRDFVLNIVSRLDVGANKVRIGLAQYSNNGKTEFLLKQHSSKGTIQDAIRRIRPKGGAPLNTGRGLDFVLKNHFTRSSGSRQHEGVPQYLIVINGGKSKDDIRPYLGLLKNAGINVLGIGAKNADEVELRQITTIPYATYIVGNFPELKRVQDKVTDRLLMEDPTIFETPEPPTEALPQRKADIVFLLDGSINIGRQNFPLLTEFVYSIVDAIYADDGAIQVGVVQYNSDVSDELFLNSYRTRDNVLRAIQNIQFKGGRSLNTGAALRHVKSNHFIKPAGSRIEEGVPQIAFLLIGGKSSDDAIAAARELKSARFKIFTVGMQDADLQEITQLATEQAGVFRVADMNTLSELTEQVLLATTDVIAGELCPNIPETIKGCNVDVLLGFDVSTVGLRNDVFATQRGFLSKAGDVIQRISQLRSISCTGSQSPNVRIGVTVFDQAGQRRVIDLVEYQPEIMTSFRKLGNFGPYVLTAGTLDAYRDTFKSDDSVKVIIHFTDGIDDNFSELKRQAEKLRREGSVHALIIVSLEKLIGLEDVSLLEFGRGFKYRRPLSINQLDLEYELAEELDNIAERVCCDVPCKCAGQVGDKGPQGPRGQKGSPGPEGIIGHPGDEGGPGERGPPGVNGTQGFQGCRGQSGIKGSRGYPGDKGQFGELGLDGIDGEQGTNGAVGPAGDKGSLGEWGTKGIKGGKGERGEFGYRGDPGEPGTTNNQQGLKGQRGDMGLVGDSGESGLPGSGGQPGRRGSQGRRGSPGARGTKGNAGTFGPPGVPGFRGQPGAPGSLGIPGREGGGGIRGPRGPAGLVAPPGTGGKIGLNGRKGEPGNPGDKGEIGPTGPRGEMGEDGKNGIGITGFKGRKGERGPVGPLGPKGEFGINGGPGKDGIKGNRGRRGYSGASGQVGLKGDVGYPGSQGPKGARGRSIETCSLVKQIKDTCPCCYGSKECPVYPTELAFVIDTSNTKTANQLNNNKNAILNIVRNLTIVESNCPKGARVAVLTYNSGIVTEIRFSSARNKRDLVKQIENLQFVPSRKESSIADAMSFVARNTFKRVRSGFLMRKVAVFFSDGQTKPKELNDGIIKLANENIISVYLSPRDDNVLTRALQRNDAGLSQFFVFRNDDETLNKVMACHVCLDFCETTAICDAKFFRSKRSTKPSDVDLDIAFIIGSSATISPNQFIEIKRYISYVTDQLEISKEPATSAHQARVAVVQHALYNSQTNNSLERVKTEFSFTDYNSSGDIREYIQNKMTQLEGTRATAHAVEWTVKNIFEKAPQPRQHKLIVLMTTGNLPEAEREKLETVVTDAKCKGFFFVVFNFIKKSNGKNLIYLASAPQDVYFKPINEISELHSEDLLRFGRQLPKYINAENALHLSPELQKRCGLFQSDQPSHEAFGSIHKQDTKDVPVDSEKLMGMELSTFNVTEDSITLHWAQTEPQHINNYEVTVIKVSQNLLVLKMNVSDAEIVLKDLESGQQYNIIVIGFYQSKANSVYNGTFTTKKSPATIAKSTTAQNIVEPLEYPEIDRCMLDFDAGSQCSEYSAKWFFDSKNNICTQFWYGGCDGNGNRFDTEAECITECTKTTLEESRSEPKHEGITLSVKDICQLQRDEGNCRNFSLKWYYDVKTKLCTRFWYGGCNGNANRFNTQDECSKTCVEGQIQTRMVTTMGT
ncbi:collagen alpha-3(VI) chain-like [Heterodontus francisci]|uniref:collagen alpha-3(VI) chain-like n=1 Tax=Heterodontus francisci TaxID=7792 RepID=UPI00355C1C37